MSFRFRAKLLASAVATLVVGACNLEPGIDLPAKGDAVGDDGALTPGEGAASGTGGSLSAGSGGLSTTGGSTSAGGSGGGEAGQGGRPSP